MNYTQIKEATLKTVKQYTSLQGSLFCYSLSFSFLFALLPSLLVFVVLIQYSLISLDSISTYLYQFLPETLIQPFVTYISSKESSDIISTLISIGISSYLASKIFYAFVMIQADHENLGYPKFLYRIKSFLLFITSILFILPSLSALIYFKLNHPIFAFILGVISLFLFYRALSFKKQCYHYGFLGALFSSISISAIGLFFFYFVSNYTSYDSIYGPLSSLVILFVSIHLVSNVIYIGYIVNLHFYREPIPYIMKHRPFYQFILDVYHYFEHFFQRIT
ncbi:MAG: YhjD/YihY/BrkB family envelope integrity protein [Erysipelotrichaceae bacterium]